MIDRVARETRFAGNPPACADELPGLRAGSHPNGARFREQFPISSSVAASYKRLFSITSAIESLFRMFSSEEALAASRRERNALCDARRSAESADGSCAALALTEAMLRRLGASPEQIERARARAHEALSTDRAEGRA